MWSLASWVDGFERTAREGDRNHGGIMEDSIDHSLVMGRARSKLFPIEMLSPGWQQWECVLLFLRSVWFNIMLNNLI